MISEGFEVTAKDFGYALEFTVRDDERNLVDLTGVTDIKLRVAELDSKRVLFTASAAVAGPPTEGKVQYTVQPTDFTKAGNFTGVLTLVFGILKEITSAPFHITVQKSLT